MQWELPRTVSPASITVQEAIQARRSCRQFSAGSIPLETLSELLWAAQGRTGKDGKRSAPSAGGYYPLQIYVIGRKLQELCTGVYRYDGQSHALELISNKNVAPMLRDAALEDQPWIGEAAVVLLIAADFGAVKSHFRTQPPQGERGARYVYIETGAAAQNVHLQAAALGLGCVLVAGFDDRQVHNVLKLPPELEPTALLCIGASAGNHCDLL